MAAAEHAAGSGPSAGEYIIHHLTHLQNHKQKSVVDFSVVNYDSIFWAALLGSLIYSLLGLLIESALGGLFAKK